MSASKKLAVFVIACMLAVWAASIPALAQNTDESDDDFIDDDSTTSITITDNSEDNDQFCAPVVNQYNNVVQGGANVLAGGDAVASVANQANVSNEVVINCINGDGNSVGGGSGSDSADDDTSDDGTSDDGDTGGDGTGDNDTSGDGTGDDGSNDDGSDDTGTDPAADVCEGARQLATLNSDGDTPTFTTSGDFILINGTYDPGGSGAGIIFALYNENNRIIDSGSIEEGGDFSIILNNSPGTYYIEASVFGGSYSATAYDCDAANSGTSNRSENTTPDIDTGVQSSVIDGTYDKDAVLAKTGGETVGLLQTGSLSALIPVGTFLMVVSMGLGVLLTSRSTRRG